MLVVLLCGLVIGLAIYIFIRRITGMLRGRRCESCRGCQNRR